jgi:hypothetical protein
MHLDILRLAITASSLTALAGCAAPSLHAAAPPPPPPRGFLASAPPADNSFYPLRCRYDGPNTVCVRDTQ